MDGVVKGTRHEDRTCWMLLIGLPVNTQATILSMRVPAPGGWRSNGALRGSLRSAGYTPDEVEIVLSHTLHPISIGGPDHS